MTNLYIDKLHCNPQSRIFTFWTVSYT